MFISSSLRLTHECSWHHSSGRILRHSMTVTKNHEVTHGYVFTFFFAASQSTTNARNSRAISRRDHMASLQNKQVNRKEFFRFSNNRSLKSVRSLS
jgi:hypothetical protein